MTERNQNGRDAGQYGQNGHADPRNNHAIR